MRWAVLQRCWAAAPCAPNPSALLALRPQQSANGCHVRKPQLRMHALLLLRPALVRAELLHGPNVTAPCLGSSFRTSWTHLRQPEHVRHFSRGRPTAAKRLAGSPSKTERLQAALRPGDRAKREPR